MGYETTCAYTKLIAQDTCCDSPSSLNNQNVESPTQHGSNSSDHQVKKVLEWPANAIHAAGVTGVSKSEVQGVPYD